jgi:hypothetical protein
MERMTRQDRPGAKTASAVGPQTIHQISAAVLAGGMMHATVIPVDLDSGAFVDGPIETGAAGVSKSASLVA